MKKMTCRQLGGACDTEFYAATFEEMSNASKKHAMEMFQKGDHTHIEAMSAMQKLMQSPDDMKAWMASKRSEFNALPDTD